MVRDLVDAETLRTIIQDKIERSDQMDGDCQGVVVNSVYWHEPDESGSNWDIHSLSGEGARECVGVVNAIVAPIKQRYNLVDESS